jgi:hypothetical protein
LSDRNCPKLRYASGAPFKKDRTMDKDKRRQPFFLMMLFVILTILGINLGEVATVLAKATKICLSCIGIG